MLWESARGVCLPVCYVLISFSVRCEPPGRLPSAGFRVRDKPHCCAMQPSPGHRMVFCPGTILPSLLAVSRRAVCLSFHHLFLWDILFYHEIVYDEVLPLHCVLAHVILE